MLERINLNSLNNRELIYCGEKANVVSVDESQQYLFLRRGRNLLQRTYSEFFEDLKKNNVTVLRSLSQPADRSKATPEQQAEIFRLEKHFFEMYKYKNPTKHAAFVSEKVAAEINAPKPIPRSTLCKKYKQWVADGYDATIQVLCKSGTYPNRIAQEIEELIAKCIKKYYLKLAGPSRPFCYEKFCKEYERKGYPINKRPSLRTFQRRIDAISEFEKVRARKGESEAKKQFRQVLNHYENGAPLDRVELDSAHFNLGLVEEISGKVYYIGTVSTDLAFDTGTGSLLGYCHHIGTKKEHSGYVVSMLCHAISQKLEKDYIQFGLPRLVVMDAGPGYRAETTRGFLDAIQCEYEITEVRRPWSKPFVERFVRYIRDNFYREIKGYVGKFNPDEYTDVTVKNEAHLTIEQFRQKFANFVREYHKKPQERLGNISPNEAWSRGIEAFPPELIDDIAELKKHKGLRLKDRKINLKDGFRYLGQSFNSPKLLSFYDAYKRKVSKKEFCVDVLVNPSDADSICIVLPPAMCASPGRLELLEIPNTCPSSSGKSFEQLRAVCKGTLVYDGAPTFISYENKSGYGETPRQGTFIDIAANIPDSRKAANEELGNMLATQPPISTLDFEDGPLYGEGTPTTPLNDKANDSDLRQVNESTTTEVFLYE
ncbi:DNA-binding domain-containing protein [Neptunicella sp. SCSIO 80796]|uniref:DNA-binding domain-containing protein n=1 Tax=Neptunicella plasticusilytica TaxID=3117012 RepID=UPI003A4DAA84